MENNPPPENPSTVDPPDPPSQTADHYRAPSTADGQLVFNDETHRTLKLLTEEIDRFIASLTSVSDKANSPAPDIPASAERYAKMVEAELEQNDSSSLAADSVLVDSVGRLGKLNTLLGVFSTGENSNSVSWLSRTSVVLQKAMVLLEDELRNILEEFASGNGYPASSSVLSPSEKTPKTTKHFSSSFHNHLHKRQDSDSSSHHRNNSTAAVLEPEPYQTEEDDFPAIPDETITQIRAIAAAMSAAGYETECCQVYSVLRRDAFKAAMKRRGFRKLSIDEIGKMSWEQLESQIATWNRVVRHTARILYPREYNLCSEVFSDYPSTGEGIMTNLAGAAVILFLTFAEGIAMTKRAAKRLFKVIEIYESLVELGSAMQGSTLFKEAESELQSEISAVQRRLGEAVIAIFSDLKDSIKNDPAKNTVPGGAVHPLTRYTMNYLRYACDFKDSLELIFQKSADCEKSVKVRSPFATELMRILAMLDANLDTKSKQYKDASLRCVFLMNNGRYILQKIKEAPEMHELVGRVAGRKRSTELRAHHKNYQRETWSKVLQCLSHDGLQVNGKVHKPILKERFKSFNQMLDEIHKTQSSWVGRVAGRKRSTELRAHHKNYQRETWSKVLQCLSHDGLQVNGKVHKPILKERFKSFNQMLDEIHKTQSSWVVSDEQLQSELRVSVSSVMIPAYRSFVARFGQYFTPGRQVEKYIKYQPEDIEATIENLFDGNPNSMGKTKKGVL